MSLRKDPTRMMVIHKPQQIEVKMAKFREFVDLASDNCPVVISVQRLDDLGKDGNQQKLERLKKIYEQGEDKQ